MQRPWVWVLSGAAHALLLAAACVLSPSFRPAQAEDPIVIDASVNPGRLPDFDENKSWNVLERSRSRRLVEYPAASVPREEPADIPHSRLPEMREPGVPMGITDALVKSADPGRGSNLGTGTTASGPGAGRDRGAGPGSRGVRGTGGRGCAAAGGGGSEEGNAVEAALKWLAGQQKPDGSWSLTPSWERPSWRFPEWRASGAKMAGSRGDAVGTALALLAYSGAGYGESDGKYVKTVRRGLDWMLKWRSAAGARGPEPHTLAITTLALCEAAALSSRGKVRTAAQKSVDQLCLHYRQAGWRRRFLVSEAIWAAFALRAAESASLKINRYGRSRIRELLLAGRCELGGFAYKVVVKDSKLAREGRGFQCATAGGVAALLCLGRPRSDAGLKRSCELALRAVEKARRDFGLADFLTLQHGAVAVRRMGGELRARWRKAAVAPTLAAQIRKGPDQGAWPTKMTSYLWSGDNPAKGNVFATALGAMILESELRHSPLYR
jgi:hypothetical protein